MKAIEKSGLALVLFLFLGSVSVFGANQYYVDGVNGHDDTGTGEPGNPYKTIQKALDAKAKDGDQIIVNPNTIYDSITVDGENATAGKHITIKSQSDITNVEIRDANGITDANGQGTDAEPGITIKRRAVLKLNRVNSRGGDGGNSTAAGKDGGAGGHGIKVTDPGSKYDKAGSEHSTPKGGEGGNPGEGGQKGPDGLPICALNGGIIIPTVSQWGLIIMAVLLVTAGAVVIIRRRRRIVA